MSPVDLSPVYFLVVDDQPFIRKLVQGMLSSLGARKIICAENGEHALKVLREFGTQIGCIISDWSMQPMNGLQLLQTVRMGGVKSVAANTPFIMLTGFADSGVVTAAASLDVNAYIVKPASANRLAEAVRLSLSRPIVAKSADHYRGVAVLEPPPAEAPPENTSTPWATWVKAGRPVFLEENTAFIQREGVKLNEVTDPDVPKVKLIRYKRADRITPGAILVEDFCDANGTVLLNAGVILSERMIAQLQSIKTEDGEPPRLWVGRT